MNAMNNRGFADMHTHMLPGMDDGPKTPGESLALLREQCAQGVSVICLTPHFYPFRETLEAFLARRAGTYSRLLEAADGLPLRFTLASETYLSDTLWNNGDLSPLCVRDARGRLFLLTELPFDSRFSESLRRRLARLIDDYAITPILAHIDRYPPLFRSPRALEELLEMGCLLQLNASSLLGGPFERRRALALVRRQRVQFLGSDCHSIDRRPPLLAAAARGVGDDAMAYFTRNALAVLGEGE